MGRVEDLQRDSDALLSIRNDLNGIDFPPGVSDCAVNCPEGVHTMVMELRRMYEENVSTDGPYLVLLRSYDEQPAVLLKRYDKETREMLMWGYSSYSIVSVVRYRHLVAFHENHLMPKSLIELQAEMARDEQRLSESYMETEGFRYAEGESPDDKYARFLNIFVFKEDE